MITSKITGKTYDEGCAVYLTNPVQCFRYFDYLGPEFFLDIIYSGEKRKDALVYVWRKCDETRRAKVLWDQHLL